MRIVIINENALSFDENSLINGGMGGSETWAIQLGEAFNKRKHKVTIVCPCTTHTAQNGILYVSLGELNKIFKQEFDLCIISRVYNDFIGKIEENGSCKNVFIQAHDPDIRGNGYKTLKKCSCFKGVSTLSKYQEDSLNKRCDVPYEDMFRIGNGVDPELFKNLDFTATNKRLLHSSCYDRGGNIVRNNVMPRYTEIIPDGGADFCSYNSLHHLNRYKNINVLGCLNKRDLYTEMSNRYCWFYPLINDETFCITMIENAMCENDLILPLDYGCSSILEPFNNDITMANHFTKNEEFENAVEEAKDRIVESINNHKNGEELRKEIKNYVLNKYTWDIIASKWEKLV